MILGYSFFQNRFDPYLSLFLAIMFASPLLIDWGTQKVGLRESVNPLRFATGFLFGIGFWFIQFTITIYLWALLVVVLYSTTMYVLTLIGRKKRSQKVEEEDDLD